MCIGAGAYAQVGANSLSTLQAKIEPRLHSAVNTHLSLSVPSPARSGEAPAFSFRPMSRCLPAGCELKAGSSVRTAGARPKLLSVRQLRELAVVEKKQRLDSIFTTLGSTGGKYSKQVFTFDSEGLPVRRVNSMYDEASKTFVPVEEYGFEWDADGYCLSQWMSSDIYMSGERHDYTYNDRKLGITQTIYVKAADGSGAWEPVCTSAYKYDDSGNIIEEQVSNWNPGTGKYEPVQLNRATWNEAGLQTLFEPYVWNGTGWQGVDERQEYSWIDRNHMTQCKSSIWNSEKGEWIYYCNLEQDFNENKDLLRREKRFYNAERADWSGCCVWNGTYYENEKTVMSYDAKGRYLQALSYKGSSPDGYTLGAKADVEWTDNADGTSRSVEYSELYVGEGDKRPGYRTTTELDADGRVTRVLDEMYSYATNTLLKDSERECAYDKDGNLLFERNYVFDDDEANARKPELSVEFTYDSFGNVVDQVNRTGGGGWIPMGAPAKDGEAWTNSTRFTYAYVNDTVRVGKTMYLWKADEWQLNTDDLVEYDFETPMSEILAWPGLDTYHTILSTSSYLTINGVYDGYINKYCYSMLNPTAIGGVNAEKAAVRVYPVMVDNGFTVDAPASAKVGVYDMGGTLVKQARPGYISASGLTAGLYIVSVDGYKTKIVKR